MKNKLKGSASLLLAVVIWGSAFIAQSVGMELIGPFTFQFIRCGLAVAFLLPVSFLLDMGKGTCRDSVRKWNDPKLWKGGIICGCARFVAASLQQIGLVYTDAGKPASLLPCISSLFPFWDCFWDRSRQKRLFSV